MFDSIINSVGEKFGLGDKAGAFVSALLALMTDRENGGFTGFINRFRKVGLGDLADSWISSGANTPISYEQVESAFGEGTLHDISEQTGVDYKTTVDATGYIVPHIIDDLTPDGEIPSEGDLLSRIGT
ncbi:MAG: YidB family protein, partial [Pyrinomonadaceae bacterium]